MPVKYAAGVAAMETFLLGAELLLLTTLGLVSMTLSLGCCCAGGGRTEGTDEEGAVLLGVGAGGAGDDRVDSNSRGGSSSRSLTISSKLTGVGVVRPTRVPPSNATGSVQFNLHVEHVRQSGSDSLIGA
jgi:hypothetical protein